MNCFQGHTHSKLKLLCTYNFGEGKEDSPHVSALQGDVKIREMPTETKSGSDGRRMACGGATDIVNGGGMAGDQDGDGDGGRQVRQWCVNRGAGVRWEEGRLM